MPNSRNDDISLKLVKANKYGFLPNVGDNEVESLEREATDVYSGDIRPGINGLTVGENTMNRREIIAATVPISSQSVRLTYFTATKSETISQISTIVGTTAAAATPTLCRIGVYKVEDNGDLTLIASTANDTTLFAAASTRYTRNLSAPFDKVRGQRYAVGILVVSGAAVPTFYGNASVPILAVLIEPKISAKINSQADLPASISNASLSDSYSMYTELLP